MGYPGGLSVTTSVFKRGLRIRKREKSGKRKAKRENKKKEECTV